MDEERIARALRQGPPGEPVYVPGRIRQKAALRRPLAPDGVSRRSIWRGLSGSLQLAATVVVVVAVIATVLFLRPQPAQQVGATPSASVSPDLLAQVRASGRLRIAIRPDSPQSSVRGSLGGFDVDVANELARRLELAPEVIALAVDEMLADRLEPGWDIAMPSAALLGPAASGLTSTEPYYWPVYVLIAAEAPDVSLADLDGQAICVVAGSSGEAWLDGGFDAPSASAIATPPGNVQVSRLATDAACLYELAAGTSEAMVTAALSEADLASRGDVRALESAVLTEQRPVVARSRGPDPDQLLVENDAALSSMRADGTLTNLSRVHTDPSRKRARGGYRSDHDRLLGHAGRYADCDADCIAAHRGCFGGAIGSGGAFHLVADLHALRGAFHLVADLRAVGDTHHRLPFVASRRRRAAAHQLPDRHGRR